MSGRAIRSRLSESRITVLLHYHAVMFVQAVALAALPACVDQPGIFELTLDLPESTEAEFTHVKISHDLHDSEIGQEGYNFEQTVLVQNTTRRRRVS